MKDGDEVVIEIEKIGGAEESHEGRLACASLSYAQYKSRGRRSRRGCCRSLRDAQGKPAEHLPVGRFTLRTCGAGWMLSGHIRSGKCLVPWAGRV